MKLAARFVAATAFLALASCSSASNNPAPGSDAATDGGATSTDATTAADSEMTMPDGSSDMTSESATGALQAPVLTDLMKMMGALHVNWNNMETDCDSVEIERKDDTNPYAVAYSVAGTINNKMDGTATANMTYNYRLRCKKGTAFSPYSNEMSANPTK